MSDDIEFQAESVYILGLVKSRSYLSDNIALRKKLDAVIDLELDLAKIGAEKAKSKVDKKEDNIRPIK